MLFSSLYSPPAWFSQIRKPALPAQIVPPSSPAILKATGGYLYKGIFGDNPLLGPCGALSLFFPSPCNRKAALSPAVRSCSCLHRDHCTVPTLGMASPALGGTWHPRGPAACGTASSSTRQRSQHRDIYPVIFFFLAFGYK